VPEGVQFYSRRFISIGKFLIKIMEPTLFELVQPGEKLLERAIRRTMIGRHEAISFGSEPEGVAPPIPALRRHCDIAASLQITQNSGHRRSRQLENSAHPFEVEMWITFQHNKELSFRKGEFSSARATDVPVLHLEFAVEAMEPFKRFERVRIGPDSMSIHTFDCSSIATAIELR
jgi:hypothetical protein